MKHFQPLTRSCLTLGMLTLTLLAGISGMAFAEDAMNKDKGMDSMMDKGKDMDSMMDKKDMGMDAMMDKGKDMDSMMDKKDMGMDAMMDKKDMGMDAMMDKGMVNINTAPAKQLQTLPGIGKALAKRIVDYRTDNGHFKSVQELVNVKGIGKETLAKMMARLTTGTDSATPMSK